MQSKKKIFLWVINKTSLKLCLGVLILIFFFAQVLIILKLQ